MTKYLLVPSFIELYHDKKCYPHLIDKKKVN